MTVFLRALLSRVLPCLVMLALCCALSSAAGAQTFRFVLRAEPDVIPANGLSTTSIFVQLPQNRDSIGASIAAAPSVRFATTSGVIESQAALSGGVARVLLRSSATPGTAIVTAFIGNSREAITVEFSEDNGIAQRYLEVTAPYIAYGNESGAITASGKTGLDFGETHIESDVRLDVDLQTERVWAQGTKGSVLIRQGRGAKAKELRGDRLFYDLRRRQGVIRRAESGAPVGSAPGESARQEFVGNDFALPPASQPLKEEKIPEKSLVPARPLQLPSPETKNEAANKENIEKEENQSLKNSLRVPLAPSLQLENDANRGSVFIQPAAPPTSPESAEAAPTENVAENGSSTITPDSLAASPQNPQSQESRATALVTVPRAPADGEVGPLQNAPAYSPLPAESGFTPRIIELPPPSINAATGYWVTARRLRVFPRDKVQFERASIFFNGQKAFALPLYVLPLDGSFNPTTDMLAFNSQGGLSLKFPFYYQASQSGTGALTLKREPGAGFGTQGGGLSLALNHQYWLSPRSHGQFSLDQLGNGPFNLNYDHQMQLSPDTNAALYVNMPRHQDVFARASLSKELRTFQVGLEAFYDRPQNLQDNLRGQFFARMRPKMLGKSGWNYTLSANALAVQHVNQTFTVGSNNSGGGVGIPGSGGGGVKTFTSTRSLFGQTLTSSLQSPVYSPWRGSALSANVLATAFNYSNGRRGLAPGLSLGLSQKLGIADLRFDYNYDRSNLGLYGLTSDSFTHYVSGTLSAQLSSKIGVSSFVSKSLNDGSLYGSADLDYFFAPKWRASLFTDYSNFSDTESLLNYGWSLGRMIGSREISLNYDVNRARVYFELGNARY